MLRITSLLTPLVLLTACVESLDNDGDLHPHDVFDDGSDCDDSDPDV